MNSSELSAVETAGMADAICRWWKYERIDFIHGAWTLGIVIGMQELCEELDLLSDVYDSERTMPGGGAV